MTSYQSYVIAWYAVCPSALEHKTVASALKSEESLKFVMIRIFLREHNIKVNFDDESYDLRELYSEIVREIWQ